MAFLPLGSRARLEHDVLCLAEAYQWTPQEVMALPCSRRHRFIKMREMIVDAQKGRTTDFSSAAGPSGPTNTRTGLGNQMQGTPPG